MPTFIIILHFSLASGRLPGTLPSQRPARRKTKNSYLLRLELHTKARASATVLLSTRARRWSLFRFTTIIYAGARTTRDVGKNPTQSNINIMYIFWWPIVDYAYALSSFVQLSHSAGSFGFGQWAYLLTSLLGVSLFMRALVAHYTHVNSTFDSIASS